jgi:hypothetical protein
MRTFIKETKHQLSAQNMHLAGGNYKEPVEGIQVKHKEATKSAREFMGVRPPTRAQSNNKPKKSSTSLEGECSISSKM